MAYAFHWTPDKCGNLNPTQLAFYFAQASAVCGKSAKYEVQIADLIADNPGIDFSPRVAAACIRDG